MSVTLDEFETKMRKIHNNDLSQKLFDNLKEEFFELSDEEQKNFFEKCKEEFFSDEEQKNFFKKYDGKKTNNKKIREFIRILAIITFLMRIFEIYLNKSYETEEALSGFVEKFSKSSEYIKRKFLEFLGIETEVILRLKLKDENYFLKLPKSVQKKFNNLSSDECKKNFNAMLSFFISKLNFLEIKEQNYDIGLLEFGVVILHFGICLLTFGIISAFGIMSAFGISSLAFGLCLGFGTLFFATGVFLIYKAIENKSLFELFKRKNVKDLSDEEDTNKNLNISSEKTREDKKLDDNMDKIPNYVGENSEPR